MAEWARLRLTLPSPFADWVSAEVVDWGSPGVQVLEEGMDPDVPPGPTMTLEIYFEKEGAAAAQERLQTFMERLGEQARPWNLERAAPVEPVDWAEQWRYHFPPLPVGERLMVLPPWEAGLDTGARLPLLLQPGMAFGTGHHPTTALILEALQTEGGLPEGGRLLDIGCGSGILSMGAVLLGAREALAFDYDRDAVVSAAENLALNGLQERVRLARARFPDLPWQGPFPLILANVYFTFFDQNAEAVRNLLTPAGVVLASGIQEEQGEETVQRLRSAGLTAHVAARRHGWVLVRGVLA